MMKFTYFALLGGSVFFPFLYSFDKRISFYKRWPSLFISIGIVAAFFVLWDIWFTYENVWSFNDHYVSGFYLFKLPLEEWLFFVIIPYACVFIYDSLKYFVKKDFLRPVAPLLTFALVILLLVFSIFSTGKIYTQSTFLLTALCLCVHFFLFRDRFLGRFYLAYLVHLIPFFAVNGVLTAIPVVMYNESENLGIRIGTVPVEDSIYSMLLLLLNITIYEFLNERMWERKELSV